MLKIDMHTHIIPKYLPKWTEKFGYGDFIHLHHRKEDAAMMMKGSKFFREIKSNCWDPEIRMEQYAEKGTQVQVVSTIPVMFSYEAKPEHGLEISRFLNDHIGELCQKYPKNYVGLGTIPMQDEELAIQELERCKSELGLPGIQIGSNIKDRNLSSPRFFPIFKACQELDMSIMIHPWNMMGFHSIERYWLPWLVGMPAETSRAACSLIFGGVMERLPDLRINFSHAGGAFLPTIGRIEHGFNCRPDLVAVDNPINPRDYIGKFWVDSITHDPHLLNYVLEMQGSKRITLGSDYPFPLGDLDFGAYIEEMELDEEIVEDIFCNATLEWLNLKRERFES